MVPLWNVNMAVQKAVIQFIPGTWYDVGMEYSQCSGLELQTSSCYTYIDLCIGLRSTRVLCRSSRRTQRLCTAERSRRRERM